MNDPFVLLTLCLVLLAACIALFLLYRMERKERRKLHFIIAHQRGQIEDFKTIADNCQEIVHLERQKAITILHRVLTEREMEAHYQNSPHPATKPPRDFP